MQKQTKDRQGIQVNTQKSMDNKVQNLKEVHEQHFIQKKDHEFVQEEQQFLILEALTPEEEMKMNAQRKRQLQLFYHGNKPYEISSWYPVLKDFTFQSVTIDLTSIDAYLLYWLYYNDQDTHQLQKQHQQLFNYYWKLLNKIDNFLEQHKEIFTQNGQLECFMKLSTRSPKDLGYKYSSHHIQNISTQLTNHLISKFPYLNQQNIKQQKISNSQENNLNKPQCCQQLSKQLINQIYKFFLELSKEKFKIKSGNDFANIFSSSERIIIDISDLSFINNNVFESFQKGNFQRADEKFIELWAREWKDFQWHEEFRCFYHNYKLTGVTQYDQRCYFPEIQSKSHLIQKQIKKFFSQMGPYLQKAGLSEGVMDLVLFGISQNSIREVKLIEINVFNRNSRGSLFSWIEDYDVLTNKISTPQEIQTPLEIRMLTQPIKISKHQLVKLMGMIDKGTDEIISLSMRNLHLQQFWNQFQ